MNRITGRGLDLRRRRPKRTIRWRGRRSCYRDASAMAFVLGGQLSLVSAVVPVLRDNSERDLAAVDRCSGSCSRAGGRMAQAEEARHPACRAHARPSRRRVVFRRTGPSAPQPSLSLQSVISPESWSPSQGLESRSSSCWIETSAVRSRRAAGAWRKGRCAGTMSPSLKVKHDELGRESWAWSSDHCAGSTWGFWCGRAGAGRPPLRGTERGSATVVAVTARARRQPALGPS